MLTTTIITKVLVSIFLTILFLQSGLDKVFDWKGNLSWLTGHFAKSPLKNMVPLLLAIVTIVELAAGGLSAIGTVLLLMTGSATVALWGAILSALSLIMLFFGQRIAKDYPGASNIAIYFGVTILSIMLLS